MTKPKSPEDRAQAAADELRTLIREAHEAAQMLSDAAKDAHTLCQDYVRTEVQAALDRCTNVMQEQVDGWADEAKDNARRLIANIRAALNAVCTVIEVDMAKGPGEDRRRTQMVIDLRGKVPIAYDGNDPDALEILASAPYQVIVEPGRPMDGRVPTEPRATRTRPAAR